MNFCWLHQRLISHRLDLDGTLPARFIRHLARCPTCAAWHRRQARLRERLAAEASRLAIQPSPRLQAEIVLQIRALADQPAAPPRFSPVLRWLPLARPALLSLLACLLAAWFLAGPWRTRPASAAGAPEALSQLTRQLEWIKSQDLLGLAGAIEKPLDQEIGLVAQDARRVLDALAYNFLPPSPPGPP